MSSSWLLTPLPDFLVPGSAAVRCRRSGGPGSHHERELVGRSPHHRWRHHVSLLQPVEGLPGEPSQHGAGPQVRRYQPREDATATELHPQSFCSRPSCPLPVASSLPLSQVYLVTMTTTHSTWFGFTFSLVDDGGPEPTHRPSAGPSQDSLVLVRV